MKVRIKYTKLGNLRFIGHLDVMRFFQKAIKRAKLDVAYSKGFSPHQIISFAAPMPLGMTSEGEYFDGEFQTVTNTKDMIDKLNATMPEEIQVKAIVKLSEDAKPSMSLVSASDYYIYTNEEAKNPNAVKLIKEKIADFISQDVILSMKKTKSKEEMVDIKESIYDIKVMDDGIYMLLAAGSISNLKPETVISAMCSFSGIEYDSYDYRTHRLETYMGEKDNLKSLLDSGEKF